MERINCLSRKYKMVSFSLNFERFWIDLAKKFYFQLLLQSLNITGVDKSVMKETLEVSSGQSRQEQRKYFRLQSDILRHLCHTFHHHHIRRKRRQSAALPAERLY